MDLTLLSLNIKVFEFEFELTQTIAMPNFTHPKSGTCRFRHSLYQDSLYSTQRSFLPVQISCCPSWWLPTCWGPACGLDRAWTCGQTTRSGVGILQRSQKLITCKRCCVTVRKGEGTALRMETHITCERYCVRKGEGTALRMETHITCERYCVRKGEGTALCMETEGTTNRK